MTRKFPIEIFAYEIYSKAQGSDVKRNLVDRLSPTTTRVHMDRIDLAQGVYCDVNILEYEHNRKSNTNNEDLQPLTQEEIDAKIKAVEAMFGNGINVKSITVINPVTGLENLSEERQAITRRIYGNTQTLRFAIHINNWQAASEGIKNLAEQLRAAVVKPALSNDIKI